MPRWMEKHFYEPGTEIAQMADWTAKVAAIAERTADRDIRLLSGMPNWALVLAEALCSRPPATAGERPICRRSGPTSNASSTGESPSGPSRTSSGPCSGPTVAFHEVYRAAEGFIAAQDAEAAGGTAPDDGRRDLLRVHPHVGIRRGAHVVAPSYAVPLSGVSAGVDYALVLTTPSGLARYVIGDIVRFVSTEPPRLTYVGRTKLQLNAFGENVIEKEITDGLLAVCRRNGWTIVNFHVAPLFPSSTTGGGGRGRHEWWVELKAGTAITPTGPIIALELDAELRRLNPLYASKRGRRHTRRSICPAGHAGRFRALDALPWKMGRPEQDAPLPQRPGHRR